MATRAIATKTALATIYDDGLHCACSLKPSFSFSPSWIGHTRCLSPSTPRGRYSCLLHFTCKDSEKHTFELVTSLWQIFKVS